MTLPNQIIHSISADLRALGVREGGVLLVHSSLRALGLPAGSETRAETAIRGLLEALGPHGTLLMPALSYESVGAANPRFDVEHTPACIGALPEAFRTRPGVQRSVHPTHSVCGLGEQAEALLRDHLLDDTPVGLHSALTRLPDASGQILFLGCGLRPNTSMHGVEEVIQPPYLFGDAVDYLITLPGGGQTTMRVRAHNFAGWEQRYDRLEGLMEAGLRKGRVLGASCFLLEAAPMWQAALKKMRADPLFFVDQLQ